jgi:hypothetical protein
MNTYLYVEDYLELLGGYDVNSPSTLLYPNNKQISLARYDVAIVDSMSSHTVFGGVLTDRQAELCVKIILKYRRQFAKINVDVTPVETPVFRHPPRKLDRSRRIWLDDQRIGLRFPYDRALIDNVQEYKKDSQGSAVWDNDEKVWWFGLTEANVNWAVAWGEAYNFEIDPLVRDLFDKILACEQTPYEIKLVQTDNGYTITNAAASLIEYVETKLGGFGSENLIKLVDYASVLGYTYDDNLMRPALLDLFKYQRNAHVVPDAEHANLDLIFQYAELTNRYPVCIYDPGIKGVDLSRFEDKDILRFNTSGKTKTCDYNIHDVKVVYANKIPSTWNYDIPLLISTQELMFGGKRMEWLNRAEKIIYYCNTLLRENN